VEESLSVVTFTQSPEIVFEAPTKLAWIYHIVPFNPAGTIFASNHSSVSPEWAAKSEPATGALPPASSGGWKANKFPETELVVPVVRVPELDVKVVEVVEDCSVPVVVVLDDVVGSVVLVVPVPRDVEGDPFRNWMATTIPPINRRTTMTVTIA